MDVWHVTWFSLATAAGATAVALPIGVPLAWLLARARFTGRSLVETIVSLPLVMPPVATGLILLMLFGRRGPLGRALSWVGIDVVFTWKAVVIAMAVMGLPLLVRTARGGFEQVDRRLEQVAATLGAGPARVFLTISLPLAWPTVVAMAHVQRGDGVGHALFNRRPRDRVGRRFARPRVGRAPPVARHAFARVFHRSLFGQR